MVALREFYSRHQNLSWLLIITAAVLGVFGRGLWFPAEIMDDVLYLNLNQKLDFNFSNLVYWWHTPILDLHSPLQMYSYMVDRLIWGEAYFVFGCHLQNFFWHIIASFLLFLICRELEMRGIFAGLVSLIFAIHPQRIESTVWLSERKDVLAVALALLCLWMFLRNLRVKTICGQLIPPFLLMASLLSKPMAILLPLILLAFLWRRQHKTNWQYYLQKLWSFLLIMLAYMVIRSSMVSGFAGTAVSGLDGWNIRLAIIANNFGNYFFKTIYPYSLFPVYPFYNPTIDTLWPGVLFGFLCVSAFGYCLARKRYNFIWFNLLPLAVCLFAALAPVVGFIRVGNTDFADRYSYFVAVFIWIFAGFFLQFVWKRLPKYRHFLIGSTIGYLVVIIVYSINYMNCWQSGRDHLEASLDCPAPNYRMAFIAGIQAFHDKDYERLQYVVNDMLKIYPYYPEDRRQMIEAYRLCMRGMLLFAQDRPNEGIKYLDELILTPKVIYMRDFSLGFPGEVMREAALYHLKRGHKERAGLVFNNLAATYESRSLADFYFFKGMSALVTGDLKTAEQFFIKAERENPKDENIRHNLENVRQRLSNH